MQALDTEGIIAFTLDFVDDDNNAADATATQADIIIILNLDDGGTGTCELDTGDKPLVTYTSNGDIVDANSNDNELATKAITALDKIPPSSRFRVIMLVASLGFEILSTTQLLVLSTERTQRDAS